MNVLHQPYPWFYPDATLMILNIECDQAALTDALADGLVLRTPARTIVWSLQCEGISGVGGYHELMVNTVATVGGRTFSTTPFIWVDNDAAMASGREVLGLGKKIAAIEQQYVNDQLVARATRSGVEFATIGMTLDREGDAEDRALLERRLSQPSLNPVADGFVEGGMDVKVTRVVHGRGFIDTRPSASDPLYLLKPVASTATLVKGDFTLRPASPLAPQMADQ